MTEQQVQPKIVTVPNVGNIQFPGDMQDDQIASAIQKNYPQLAKPTTKFSDQTGNTIGVGRNPAAQKDALDRGAKVGPASQQKFGGESQKITPGVKSGVSMNAPVSSTALGVASGLGVPESEHPVWDMLTSAFRPHQDPEVENAAQALAINNPVGFSMPLPVARIVAGIGKASKDQIVKGAQELQDSGIDSGIAAKFQPQQGRTEQMAIQEEMANMGITKPFDSLNPMQQQLIKAFAKSNLRFHPTAQKDVNLPAAASGVVHLAAGAFPAVGPAAVGAGEEIDQGIQEKDIDKVLHGVGSGVGTVGGLALGSKTGQAATEAAIAKTVRPAMEAVTGATSLPVKATARALGGGEAAMAKRPIPQATAAGTASNAEMTKWAKSKGIDLLPGQATGARGLQTVQAIGERAIVAPGQLPEVLEGQKAAFGNAVDQFKAKVSAPDVVDTETAGQNLKKQAQTGLDNLKASAQKDYAGFQAQAGDIPVDLSDVKVGAKQALANQAEALKNVPARYSGPIKNVLNKLANLEPGGAVDPKLEASFQGAVDEYGLGPDQAAALREKMGLPAAGAASDFKMSTAQQLRSAYLDIARDYSGNVPKSVQRYAGQAARDIDAAMAKAADSVGASDQWRQANAKWKQLQETYNNPEHPLYKVLQEPDATKVSSRLLGKGDFGGSPQTIRQMQQVGIDLAPLKREVAQRIADRNFALTNGGRGLAGYSTDFLQTLYTPEELRELTTMGRVGRAIKFEMNPSGTSNVQQGERQIHGIIHRTAGAVIGPLASRLTTSKALARAAMGDVGAASTIESRPLLGLRGGQPPEPPMGGSPQGPGASLPPAPRSVADIISGKGQEAGPAIERRQAGGSDLRNILEDAKSKMSSDQSTEAMFSDEKTNMPNRKAYNIAKPALENTHPNIGSADIDDFKNHNSILGKEAVDTMVFPAVGKAMREAVAAENGTVHAFHVHGDEFKFLASEPAAVGRVIDKVNAALKDHVFTVEKADGTIITNKGPRFSYGVGTTEESAAASETAAKQAAKDAGLRLGNRPQVGDTPAAQPGTGRQTPVNQGSGRNSVSSLVHEVLGEHAPTLPQQTMTAGDSIGGNYGADTQVKTTSASLPAKYKVVEADSLVPSHNAQTFAKNPQYPEGVQERAYHSSKEAQNRVIQQAQNYDPAYTINTNPDAVNGPPVVTKDGIVLGGNSRTMSTQRLYKAGAGDAYRSDLAKNAAQFGVTPEQISGMKQPVLVREVATPANIEEARRIGADLNRNMTGAMGQGEKSVSAGRSVKPQTLSTISGMVNDMGEGATLRDAMRQNGKDIINMMVKDGVIGERERPQFIDTSTGGINEEGKTFVERALVGSVVDDPRLMDRVPKSVLGKLEGSLGDLAAVGARTDEYNLLPLVREALAEHAEMAMRGLDADKYLAQSNMFGQSNSPAVEAMTRSLAGKPKAFRDAVRQYAQDAKFDQQGQGLLGLTGGKPSAAKAFNEAFGANLTDEQFHDSLLQSYKKEATIGANAGQETGNPKTGGNLRETATPQARTSTSGRTAKAESGQQAQDQPRSISDILSGKPANPKRKK